LQATEQNCEFLSACRPADAVLRDAYAVFNAGKDRAAVLQTLEVSGSTLDRRVRATFRLSIAGASGA
jgi:hypothetical protein